MKIIRPGKLPEKRIKKYRGTCSNCGCEVLCTENEMMSFYRTGGALRCPTEGCLTYISPKEVKTR